MAVLFIASGAAPATTCAGASNEPILQSLVEGGTAISLGVDVTPFRGQLGPAVPVIPSEQGGERARPDSDARGTVISLGLKLERQATQAMMTVEPYLTLGPALFVVEPHYVSRLLASDVDPTLRLGAKASAGLNWWLGKNTMVFGAYEVTTAGGGDPTLLGAKSAADPGIGGYGFTYGLRFRY